VNINFIILGKSQKDLTFTEAPTFEAVLKQEGVELREGLDDKKNQVKDLLLCNGVEVTDLKGAVPENAVLTVVPKVKGGC